MASESMWDGVKKRLEKLADSAHRFEDERGWCPLQKTGSEFVVLSPLTLDEVEDAESQLDITFPEDYRSFLLDVSAGGLGPAYGLFSIRQDETGKWNWEQPASFDQECFAPLTDVSKEFAPGFSPEVESFLKTEPAEGENPDHWFTARADIVYAPEQTQGSVVISEVGSAICDLIVFTGKHRGTIWRDRRTESFWGLQPLVDDSGSPIGFRDWYLSWLEAAEVEIEQAWRTPPSTEEKKQKELGQQLAEIFN